MAVSVEEIIDGLEKGNFGPMMKVTLSNALDDEVQGEELLELDDLIYDEKYDTLREKLEERDLLKYRLEYEEYISNNSEV